ncbi:hypothetical protein RJ640_000486 [Escallonia rubra]|uniref:Protein FAR1-RELATED SEQUENCE n=1 Tax=Escallonia rubra TaxID=112253 RepID=A0AA88U494_9ASTE|nr:hypothetical protein RJ640_000486 [Escallonia rubra]
MYNLRTHWAKSFLNNTFLAGMTTSGRSESIHSFFDGYVNSNTMLNEFVVKYDKAVYNRRNAEEDEDFKTMTSKSILSSDHPIERKAGDCYTRSLFEICKKEWNASVSCSHITWSKEPNVTKYRVGLITVDKEKWRTVYYYSSEDVRASFKMVEQLRKWQLNISYSESYPWTYSSSSTKWDELKVCSLVIDATMNESLSLRPIPRISVDSPSIFTSISYPLISHYSRLSLRSNKGAEGCSLKVSLITDCKYLNSLRPVSSTFLRSPKTFRTSACALFMTRGDFSISDIAHSTVVDDVSLPALKIS